MSKKLILIVDDESDVRIHLTGILRSAGFKVLGAKDGAEAIDIASKHKPDMILLDIQLPIIDGFEVLNQLKNNKIETRVIMISGVYFDIDTVVRCIKAGACDFIQKPCPNTEIINIVKKSIIVDSTTNFRISDFPPLLEKYIIENGKLQEKLKSREKKFNKTIKDKVVIFNLYKKENKELIELLSERSIERKKLNHENKMIFDNRPIYNQTWSHIKEDFDANILIKEFKILREELKKIAKHVEDYSEIGAIVDAEIEILNGNGANALSSLGKVGKWAGGVAEKIGVNVASAFIKAANGL